VNKVADANRAYLNSIGKNLPEEYWQWAKQEQLRKYSEEPNYLKSRHLNESLRRRMNIDVGVLCLSKSNKSILMWSHYSAGHTGFVLGFDAEDNFFKQRPHEPHEIGELQPVTYSPKRVGIIFPPAETDPTPNIFFTKNEEWRYEDEWRILRFPNDADKTPDANVHLFSIPPSAIREVIFGNFAPPDLISDLTLAKQAHSDLSHVQFYQAKLSPDRFEMDIMPYGA